MLTIFERTKRHRVSDVEAAQDESDRMMEHRQLAGQLAELEAAHASALPPLRAMEETAGREVEEARSRLQAAEAGLGKAISVRRTATAEFDRRTSTLVNRLLATTSPTLEAAISLWKSELEKCRNVPLLSQVIFKKRADVFSPGGKDELTNNAAVGRRLVAIKEAIEKLESLRLLSDPSESEIALIAETIPPMEAANVMDPCPPGWRTYNT